MKRTMTWAVAAVGAALGLSACGSAGGGSTTTSTTPSSGLAVGSTRLGKVLVDGKGMTLYMLTSDKPGQSRCAASCLAYWPPAAPLATGAKPAGVSAAVAVTKDTAGKQMLTVAGWPLYTFLQDKAPGDVTGEGVKSFGGTWWVVSPTGVPMTGPGGASAPGY